jgi:hypothetical protein
VVLRAPAHVPILPLRKPREALLIFFGLFIFFIQPIFVVNSTQHLYLRHMIAVISVDIRSLFFVAFLRTGIS